jgi:hypothetical protein
MINQQICDIKTGVAFCRVESVVELLSTQLKSSSVTSVAIMNIDTVMIIQSYLNERRRGIVRSGNQLYISLIVV